MAKNDVCILNVTVSRDEKILGFINLKYYTANDKKRTKTKIDSDEAAKLFKETIMIFAPMYTFLFKIIRSRVIQFI